MMIPNFNPEKESERKKQALLSEPGDRKGISEKAEKNDDNNNDDIVLVVMMVMMMIIIVINLMRE